MIRQLPKIIIIALVTMVATNMPHLFAKDINGFVPSDEVVSRHLGVSSASPSSRTAAFDIKNDIAVNEIDNNEMSEGGGQEKVDAYNEKSGKVLGKVSDKAKENENPIISCEDSKANCDFTPTPTPSSLPTNTPTAASEPKGSPRSTPTTKFIPTPLITVIPLPSKFPTLYPCPPIPLEASSKKELIIPCTE
jgi:hypothetical protein